MGSEAELVELRVHVDYMRDAVDKIVEKMEAMPTAEQFLAMKSKLDKIEAQQAEQTKLMDTLVTLERFAKWFTVIAAAVGTAYATWRAVKGG
jgi:uncharacterized coiled-coil protein SlyX